MEYEIKQVLLKYLRMIANKVYVLWQGKRKSHLYFIMVFDDENEECVKGYADHDKIKVYLFLFTINLHYLANTSQHENRN